MIRKIYDIRLEHGGLPQPCPSSHCPPEIVLPDMLGDHSELFLLFSVSPRPFGFLFFSFWVFGLRVWGQGLTIFIFPC